MPAIPSLSVWPAIGLVLALAILGGVLVALLDTRFSRSRQQEPVDEIVLPGAPSQTVLDQLATYPEEQRDLRRSA